MGGVIINGDDFGANSNCNAAISYCFRKNIINSTTMMVNTDEFEEAIELANNYSYKDKIGIHLNLTHGKSLTDLSQTGLTDENGIFIRKSISNKYIYFSSSIKNKIKKEIKQQYNKLLDANIVPTHIDSHHHVHTIPWIAGIFIEFAKKNKQKIRIANENIRRNPIARAYLKILNNEYKRNHLNFSDKFERVSSFIKYYNKIKDKHLIYEIMVHPTFVDGNLIDGVDRNNLEESLINLKQYF